MFFFCLLRLLGFLSLFLFSNAWKITLKNITSDIHIINNIPIFTTPSTISLSNHIIKTQPQNNHIIRSLILPNNNILLITTTHIQSIIYTPQNYSLATLQYSTPLLPQQYSNLLKNIPIVTHDSEYIYILLNNHVYKYSYSLELIQTTKLSITLPETQKTQTITHHSQSLFITCNNHIFILNSSSLLQLHSRTIHEPIISTPIFLSTNNIPALLYSSQNTTHILPLNAPFTAQPQIILLSQTLKLPPSIPLPINPLSDLPYFIYSNNIIHLQSYGSDFSFEIIHTFKPPKNSQSVISTSNLAFKGENSITISLISIGDEYTLVETFDSSIPPKSFKIPLNTISNGKILVTASKYVENSLNLFIQTSDGLLTFYKDNIQISQSDESLANIVSTEFMPLANPKTESIDNSLLFSDPFAFILNSKTTILLPISSSIIKFFKENYENSPSKNPSISSHADKLAFNQYWIVATSCDTIVAIDTASGNTIWRIFLKNAAFKVLKLVRGSDKDGHPLLNALGATNIQINGLTGEYSIISTSKYIYASVLDLVDSESQTLITVFVKENNIVSIYPNTKSAHLIFQSAPFYFYLNANIGSKKIEGYKMNFSSSNAESSYMIQKTWTFTLPENEIIATLGKQQTSDDVASIGRVLGDRTVLYKYLNPNMLAFISESVLAGERALYIYLLDTVSGILHMRAVHAAAGKIGENLALQLLQCENFVIYSYWNYGPKAGFQLAASISNNSEARKGKYSKKMPNIEIPNAKSMEVVVLELFESEKPDRRSPGTGFSSFGSYKSHILSQAYTFSETITAIGVTKTRQGITTKEILFGLISGQLYGVNKRFLDPRRPNRKLTAEDQEEGLLGYKVQLDYNPKFSASDSQYVAGITNIVSSSTVMESTSLVIAYGLDIFATLRRPSKTFDVLSDDFNYFALVGTILILFILIGIANFFAKQKALAQEWK